MIDNNIRFRIMPEDAYFILKFNQYSKKVIFLDEVVYYWRVHIDSEGRNKKNVSPAWITSHFKDICSFYKETINWEQCNNISNRELSIIEFSLLKQYYLLPLHALRFLRHKKRFECYDVLHNTLKQNFPNYLDNPYLKIGRESPARKYATNIIRTCAIFEKFHVFKCVLFLYYIVRKFVYFDE